MKTKKSVLLSAIAMLVLSGAAMGTGTFAWFTSIRQVDVNFDQFQVVSSGGNLNVTYLAQTSSEDSTLDDYATSTSEGELNITASANNKGTDISGNGLNFYKPNWKPGASVGTANSADSISTITVDEGNFVDFKLTVSRSDAATGATEGLKVYLGVGTTVAPKTALNTNDEAAANSSRIAILNADASAVLFHYAPVAETDSKYITTAATGTDLYGVDKFTTVTADVADLYTPASPAAGKNYVEGALANRSKNTDGTHTTAGNVSPLIADLTNTVTSLVITVRVWIEGTDEQATATAVTGLTKVTLDFYALDVKPAA